MLDYAADPDVPLLWRFQKSMAGGGIAIDTGYHLVDCARFLVGEIDVRPEPDHDIRRASVRCPAPDAIGNRGGGADGRSGPSRAARSTSRTPQPRW